MGPDPVTSTFITAQDGLRLHVRAWGPRLAARLPVVCLPGLARTGAYFETLANALAGGGNGTRLVLALDLRGRGRSLARRSLTGAKHNRRRPARRWRSFPI